MTTETTPRTCVFCGAPSDELTKEHVFPKWLRNVVGDGPARHSYEFAKHGKVLSEHSHEAEMFSVEVRRVCGRCNSGWMNDLENAARPLLEPLLQGRGRALHATGQRHLAAWAFKTTIMYEFAAPAEQRAIPTAHHRYLFEHGEPPQGVYVSLAAYAGSAWSAYGRHHPLRIGEGVTENNGYVATLGINKLVLHVLGVEDPQFQPHIGPALAACLVPIWPYGGSITFTSHPALTDRGLRLLADGVGAAPGTKF